MDISQLRVCYHLNDFDGYQTIGADNVDDGLFEPPNFKSSDRVTAKEYDGTTSPLQTWDQLKALGSPDLTQLNTLVRIVGRVQTHAEPSIGAVASQNPDIVAFLEYAARKAPAWSKLGPVYHPGHADDVNHINDVLTTQVANSSSLVGGFTPSDIVLILSESLDSTKIPSIQSAVDTLTGMGIRIFVVFFATEMTQEGSFTFPPPTITDSTLDDFKSAFRVGTTGNKVIRIRPPTENAALLSAGLDTVCNSLTSGIGNSDTCYQHFYTELASPGVYSNKLDLNVEKISEIILSTFLFEKV